MSTPTITLGAQLRALKQATGNTLKQLSVLSEGNDPYRQDTPANHRDSEWLASRMVEYNIRRPIHFRGIHYVLVTRAPVKPNGEIYANTAEDWFWMSDKVGRAVRWLGYVPFADIVDERNAPPIIRPAARLHYSDPFIGLTSSPDLTPDFDPRPRIRLSQMESPQRYRLAQFGEKTSLDAVLGPLAEEYNTDLFLAGGEQTTSHLYHSALHASQDGRELIVFVYADCDPSGYQMIVSIAHKLRAFKDSLFPRLRYRVYAPALTVDQVGELGLPSNPLKETESRAGRWRDAYGIEQTEIDALATLQPDVLEQIAREAIAPFFDNTLSSRIEAAADKWEAAAQRKLNAAARRTPGYGELQTRAQDSLDDARAALDALDSATGSLIDTSALPNFDMPEPNPPASQPVPLVSSGMDLEEHIDQLQRRKNYEDD